jgi:hypothetical protein
VSAGECRDDTNTVDITIPALTKQLDAAWAAGTNAGGRDTGAIADGSWHLYVIMKADRTTDALFTATFGSPTMPSGYVYKRRLGSFVRASGAIRTFKQYGNYFAITAPVDTHAGIAIAASTTVPGSLVASVPSGQKLQVNLAVTFSHSAAYANAWIYDPDATQPARFNLWCPAPAGTGANSQFVVWCSNAQVSVTSGATVGTHTFYLCPIGWWDSRDRDR